MLKSDKLEFEHGAAAKTENEDRYNGKENRHHDRNGTAGSRKSLASLGPVEILSKDRRVLAQSEMRARFVVVGRVGGQNTPQMGFAKDQDVIQTVVPQRPDQPLHICVLPG